MENTEYFSLPDFPESRSSSSEYQSDSNIDVNQDSGNYSLPPSSSNSSHGTSPPRKISYGKNPAPLPPKMSPPNKALVIYDYNKKTPTEVSLEKSQVVQILDSKPGAEWWRVKDDFGRIGYYPSHYLRMIWWNSIAQLFVLFWIFYFIQNIDRLLLNSLQMQVCQTEWWWNILNVRCTYIN